MSRKAAAIWFPYKAQPQELIEDLSFETLRDYEFLIGTQAAIGVSMATTHMVYNRRVTLEDEPILAALESNPMSPGQLPQGYISGWEFSVPFIDTSIYMPSLLSHFCDAGGTLVRRNIQNLRELKHHGLVINCSGLGAKELCQDRELFPIRGQVIRMTKPLVPMFLIDESDEDRPGYIFARHDDCIVGGSALPHATNLEPCPDLRQDILDRAKKMYPELGTAQVIEDAVGLRPGRSQLRLESQWLQDEDLHVFHNYGHGGSGFTISWGCARRAVQWVSQQTGIQIDTSKPPLFH